MSSDALVFDMANSSREDPSVFVKKDWLTINDSMNESYVGNEVIIETSALSNSNKYLDYRQGYLQVPLLLTLTSNSVNTFKPATSATSADHTLGLKNWIGSVFHNLTIEMNGTTICQQTNFLPLYNNFKLLTSLSYGDYQMFSSIGFCPDDALSFVFTNANSENGTAGVSNNQNALAFPTVNAIHNTYHTGNKGFLTRQQYWNFDTAGTTGVGITGTQAYSTLLISTYANQLHKSHIFNKIDGSATAKGVFQMSCTGICYLRHLHDFFDKMPLLKGVFLRIRLGISNVSVAFTVASSKYTDCSVTNALGGVNPLMLASCHTGNGGKASLVNDSYIASLAIGGKVLDATQKAITGVQDSPLARSVSLHIASYTMVPQLEIAYLSKPIKRISYEDTYQFTIQKIASGSQINSLISNGISNLKKVICMSVFTASGNQGTMAQIQSPFDGCGGGTLAPLAHLSNFNVVVSGANTFLNSVKYNYEMFQNHVLGTNSVNGGLTDGVGSSFINSQDWETSYGYYVADVGRMLEVEKDVPKSLSIVGQSLSTRETDMYVFAVYGTEIVVDALTGSRTA
jgi:hypothetical protein